jgi:tRNA 2-thiouridine synthesizing protein A
MTPPTPKQTLDLRTTKCPLNFVKTKLALEKLALGDILEIWIATDSQSSINIPQSIAQEGHTIVYEDSHPDYPSGQVSRLWIEKTKSP